MKTPAPSPDRKVCNSENLRKRQGERARRQILEGQRPRHIMAEGSRLDICPFAI